MKIFIFANTSLDSGHFINEGKSKVVKLSTLRDCNDVLFVLPNEFLSYIKHTAELKNKKNLHASIINSINTIGIENQSELEVLECNNSNENFFTITKNKLERLKDRFKHIDSKIKITSDLLFFREVFKTNIGFNESIFYEEGDSLVKLTKKAFDLLDKANEKISYKVREHSVSKVPIIIAVGKKEVSDRTVSVRRLGSDDTSVLSLDDFTSSVFQESLAPNK